jgi:PsbP-like protein
MSNKSLKSLTIDFVIVLLLFSLVFSSFKIWVPFLTSFAQELGGEGGGLRSPQEICDNGVDEDGDGMGDTDDEDCASTTPQDGSNVAGRSISRERVGGNEPNVINETRQRDTLLDLREKLFESPGADLPPGAILQTRPCGSEDNPCPKGGGKPPVPGSSDANDLGGGTGAGIGTGAGTPSNTSTPTGLRSKGASNFQQYENTNYGIKLQFPVDWAIAVNEETLNDHITRVVKLDNNSNASYENLDILINNFPVRSLNEYLANSIITYVQNNENFSILDSGTNATLAGNPAYKIVYDQTIDGVSVKGLEVGTIIGNKAYYIQYSAEPEQYSKNIKIIQDVINSFNVTKS